MKNKIHMSILPILAAWRPLGLLVLLVTGVLGLIDLATFGEIMAPREQFVQSLIAITAIELLWHVGRTIYDAPAGVESIATALIVAAGEMAVRLSGCASLIAMTSALASATKGTAVETYTQLVHLAVFCAVGVVEIGLMLVHWRGEKGAVNLLSRFKAIVQSRGQDVDAVIGTSES